VLPRPPLQPASHDDAVAVVLLPCSQRLLLPPLALAVVCGSAVVQVSAVLDELQAAPVLVSEEDAALARAAGTAAGGGRCLAVPRSPRCAGLEDGGHRAVQAVVAVDGVGHAARH